jgi:hypothetical protein
MIVAAGGNGGSGERCCSNASECDRWKLPHENVLQKVVVSSESGIIARF